MNQPPPKKRFLYNKNDMCKALEAVASGMQINTASKKYSVPRTSLYNKAKKAYKSDTPGPSTVLMLKEEEDLVQWVLQMCSLGCPVTKEHLFNSVAVLIKKLKRANSFTDGRPGRHWFDGFLRRHPVLTQRMSKNTSFARALVSEESLKKWFTDVASYLRKENLQNIDGSRIFNTDEIALLLNPKGGSVLAAKGSKNVYNIVNNNEKEKLTVLVTGNAAGRLAPTLVVFDYQRVPSSIYAKLPPEFHVGTSEKGWMTSELFYEYIANTFYPWVAASGIQLPIILFLDGHVSRMTQPLSAFCHDHHIILVILPPNTTYLMQPMDVTMFSPLKAHWRKEVNAYRIENHVLSVAKHDFAVLLANVFTKMDLKTILSSGFSACGLHPFTIDKLDLSKVFIRSKNNDSETTINQESTINQEPSLIESFEKYIDPDTLKQFRACGEVEKWEGQTNDTNLYHVWKSIRADCYKTNIKVCSEIHNDNFIEPLSGQVLHDEPTLQHIDCVTDVEQKENLPMEVLNPEVN